MKLNKISHLLFALIFALLLTGCGTADTSKPEVDTKQEEAVEQPEAVEEETPVEADKEEATPETSATKTEEPKTKPETETTKDTSTEQAKTTPKEETKVETTKPKTETTKPKVETTKPKTETAPPVQEEKKQEEPKQTVTISITGPTDVGTIVGETKVSFQEGDTVLDVLLKIADKNNIHVSYTGTGAMAYVEGIDNYYEFDYGPKSGWTCRLNGPALPKSADAIKVKAGDRIEWIYTEDYSKDKE